MISLKSFLKYRLLVLSLILILAGCGQRSDTRESKKVEEVAQIVEEPTGLVEVKAVGLTLEAQDQIPSGWTTFRFINDTDMIHLAYLYRLPAGIRLADHKQVAAVFQNFMDEYNGRPHSEPDAGMELPEWFGNVVAKGGPGLVSRRKIAETTVFVEPGVYLMECYVKTDGVFHSYNSSSTQHGMVHEFTVTEEDNQVAAPIPTINISVSGENGMSVGSGITAGSHIVGVSYSDQTLHENFLGHDVHLVKVNHDTDLEQVVQWMDWREPTGLQTPTTTEFLGGVHEFPAGEIAYFHVELEPGKYAWISEVPNALEKGLLVEFEVMGAP